MLFFFALCAAGAPVSVLCEGPLGPGACDLPAEERRRPGPHASRRLAGPGGRSGSWRLRRGELNLFKLFNHFQQKNCDCAIRNVLRKIQILQNVFLSKKSKKRKRKKYLWFYKKKTSDFCKNIIKKYSTLLYEIKMSYCKVLTAKKVVF